MPPPSRQRGSGGPLLRDYLTANKQQGAQQAQGMATYLGQQQQGARSQVDAAQQAITQQRLQPAYGTQGQVGGVGVPGIGGYATPTPEMANKVLEAQQVQAGETEAGRSAISQVGRASALGQMATTPAGMAAINAQRMGMGGPRTSGGSMLDAATTNYGGGGQVRAQARQGAGLRDYLTGATTRGNEAAEAQARQWIAAGTPPSSTPAPAAPLLPSKTGRPPAIEGTGQPQRPRDWLRQRKEDDFDGGG
jgi:hypothetical protein